MSSAWSQTSGQVEDDEDDYMSMVIEEPQSKRVENSIQRAARRKREVGASGHEEPWKKILTQG